MPNKNNVRFEKLDKFANSVLSVIFDFQNKFLNW